MLHLIVRKDDNAGLNGSIQAVFIKRDSFKGALPYDEESRKMIKHFSAHQSVSLMYNPEAKSRGHALK